ncbi:hypothetical protein PUN28_003275 [Cardiocondyla obscurior]|uniref:Uncharacterized protein n=1 Tax=Cardiocondyla obscurior TaxID=286306 RepID=A0AAW2GN29_9HYME
MRYRRAFVKRQNNTENVYAYAYVCRTVTPGGYNVPRKGNAIADFNQSYRRTFGAYEFSLANPPVTRTCVNN